MGWDQPKTPTLEALGGKLPVNALPPPPEATLMLGPRNQSLNPAVSYVVLGQHEAVWLSLPPCRHLPPLMQSGGNLPLPTCCTFYLEACPNSWPKNIEKIDIDKNVKNIVSVSKLQPRNPVMNKNIAPFSLCYWNSSVVIEPVVESFPGTFAGSSIGSRNAFLEHQL